MSVAACTQSESPVAEVIEKSKLPTVVDSSIVFHGGDHIGHSTIRFSFRKKNYSVSRDPQSFEYISIWSDSLGNHRTVLTDQTVMAFVDNQRLPLSAKDSASIAGSLNSVVYFALQPYFLSDHAVNATLEGTENIGGKAYSRVKITFAADGGGTDFEDVYFYWFDKADASMDYFAYSFTVNEGGTRFRAAKNSRRINGVVFQDYDNYEGPASPDSLPFISELYKAGTLKKLSEINLDKIAVIENAQVVASLQP